MKNPTTGEFRAEPDLRRRSCSSISGSLSTADGGGAAGLVSGLPNSGFTMRLAPADQGRRVRADGGGPCGSCRILSPSRAMPAELAAKIKAPR